MVRGKCEGAPGLSTILVGRGSLDSGFEKGGDAAVEPLTPWGG